MDTKKFIEKSKKIHKNKYVYSLVEYKNAKTKIKIICKEHGEFEQTPNNHLYGKKGCKKCSGNARYTTKEIINKMKEAHGNEYNYSLVNYEGTFKKLKITCKEHGEFEQTYRNHIKNGCPYCNGNKINTKIFIKEAKKTHGDKYDYSLVKYKKAKEKIKIICKKHGIFEQDAYEHKIGKGCKKCTMSKGEQKIKSFLDKKNIKFEQQKMFENCTNPKTKKYLRFDFHLSDYNICIEYDGEQHFLPMRFSKNNNEKELKNLQNRDRIKNEFCKKNKIKIIRIKYTKLKEIDDILNSIID